MVVLQLFNRERRSAEEFEAVNREHMEAYKDAITAYGWFYPVVEFISMLALAGILTYGGFRVRPGHLSLGVVAAFLQYGLRFFRPIQDLSEKVQHPAIRHGLLRAHFQAARYRARGGRARVRRARARRRLRQSNSITSGSPTRAKTGCCATSASPSRPARPSPWWAIPAPARPRSSACCCASTTCSAAAFAWAAWTCATSIRWSCAAVRRGAAGPVPVHRHAGGEHPAGHGEHPATSRWRQPPSRST